MFSLRVLLRVRQPKGAHRAVQGRPQCPLQTLNIRQSLRLPCTMTLEIRYFRVRCLFFSTVLHCDAGGGAAMDKLLSFIPISSNSKRFHVFTACFSTVYVYAQIVKVVMTYAATNSYKAVA